MSAAHTPGPWSWGDDYQGLFGSGPNNEVLTHYNYEGMHLSYGDKQAANARLIAAAPDWLAALQKVMTWIDNWSPDFTQDNEWRDDEPVIRAAIARATGATA